MASHRIPANPVGLYWVYWAPFQRLVQFPTTYNVLFLFHAYPAEGEPVGGSTGAVVLRTPSGTPGTFMNADIATCRARGQKVILSVGGAGGQVYLTSQSRADAFITSIKAINVQLGGSGTTNAIDGLDWNNFEGVSQGAQGAWMSYIGQQLRAYYGDDFIFTAPPAASFFEDQNTYDRLLVAELYKNGVIDWICPQFYDGTDNALLSNVRTQLDWYNTAVTIGGTSVQIPRDYIGIGFSIGSTTGNKFWTTSGASSAYSTVVADGRTPKGAFNWANHLDTGNTFATSVAPVITNNSDPVVDNPHFELSLSSNFTDGTNTTAQLTAPSGKTSADFQAGEMCETSNPAPAINLASGKYTEVEWCIQATTYAEDAAQYEFRITYFNSNSLNSYLITPKWTIGTPPQPPPVLPPTPPDSATGYLIFDGDGDYVQVPDSNAYSVPTTGTLTVSVWMRPDTLLFSNAEDAGDEGTYVMWLGKGTYGAPNTIEWGFRMYSNDGTRPNRISFYVFNSTGGIGVGSYFQDQIVVGEWIHVTATVSANNTSIYKNGVFRDTDVYTSGSVIITPSNTTSPLRIGTMTTTGFFEGALNDVCIWNRVLTQAEITALQTGTVAASGLVGRWRLDDGSGNTAVDDVSANNGTLNPGSGSPAWYEIPVVADDPKSTTGIGSITGLSTLTF